MPIFPTLMKWHFKRDLTLKRVRQDADIPWSMTTVTTESLMNNLQFAYDSQGREVDAPELFA